MRNFTRFGFASSIVSLLVTAACSHPTEVTLETPPAINITIELPPSPSDAGSDSAAETALTDAASTGQLIITADPTNSYPARSVYKGEPHVGMLQLYLNAVGTDQVVEQLSFKHEQVGSMYDFESVWLVSDYPFGLSRCDVNTVTSVVTCGGKGYAMKTIPAGTQSAVRVVVDYAATAAPGAQHGFELVSAADVVTRDPTTVVSGDFAFNGNVFAVSSTSWTQLTVAAEETSLFIEPCGKDVTLFVYSLTGAEDRLEIKGQKIQIDSTNGGYITGSKGTEYFANMRTVFLTYEYIGEIMQLPTETYHWLAPLVEYDFVGMFYMDAAHGSTRRLIAVQADTACSEDAPGEFGGHDYRITLLPMTSDDVSDDTTGAPLDVSSRLSPAGKSIVSGPIRYQSL